jgi:cell division septation protein DedD
LQVAVLGIAASLSGCQGFREATGAAKLAPDEFLVITKSPLIIPPDFNLRPPTPGAPDANRGTTADMARAALFGQDPQMAAAALPGNFSTGERNLLARSRGSLADPAVRQAISNDSGLVDQGQAFAERIIDPATAGRQFAGATETVRAPAPMPPASQPATQPLSRSPGAPAAARTVAASFPSASAPRPSVPVAAPVASVVATVVASRIAPGPASNPLHASAVLLQLGAYTSEERANEAWRSFRARHAAIAGSLSNEIQVASIPDRGTLYRLRIGPFPDRAAAMAACDALKAKGGACLVAHP